MVNLISQPNDFCRLFTGEHKVQPVALAINKNRLAEISSQYVQNRIQFVLESYDQ